MPRAWLRPGGPNMRAADCVLTTTRREPNTRNGVRTLRSITACGLSLSQVWLLAAIPAHKTTAMRTEKETRRGGKEVNSLFSFTLQFPCPISQRCRFAV